MSWGGHSGGGGRGGGGPWGALIADIKRHSLEDGPGIRSVVFFKGCPLRCDFCHNPEMQRTETEIAFRSGRCVACGQCASVCSRQAISLVRDGRIDRDACEACGACAVACPSSALDVVGRAYQVDDLVEVLLRDEPYYRSSGGGVTWSGGECTMFPEYLLALARTLAERRIHQVIETAGTFAGDWFVSELLPWLDLVFFDLKLADPDLHRRHCGQDNRRILDNLALLWRAAPERVHVRVPLVPGVTATEANLRALGATLRALGVPGAILLPYNPLGRGMAGRLGRTMPASPEGFMREEEVAEAVRRFAAAT
jgi:pyruvate formate lyase activating enzyme